MTPLDYVAPVQVEAASVQDASAADELEWLAIEAAAVPWGCAKLLVPAPDGFKNRTYPWTPGSPYWLGPKASSRMHPRAYRVRGASTGTPARAKSPLQAELLLTGTSTTYRPPQLGPWPLKSMQWCQLVGRVRELRYNQHTGTWK